LLKKKLFRVCVKDGRSDCSKVSRDYCSSVGGLGELGLSSNKGCNREVESMDGKLLRGKICGLKGRWIS
jgi:hypothetical protein